MVVIMQNIHKKGNLKETKVNAMKARKVHVDGNKFCFQKEWRS